jgi:outer membrane biosynthesis protein TonB
MADHFESQKNFKATGYTAVACALLVFIFFMVSWTLPVEPPPPVEDGIEVNLGNSDKGLGKDQPFLPGQPSAEDKEKYTPPKPAVVEKAPAKDVETDDNNKEDAPVVKKAVRTKPNATRIPDKEETRVKARPVKTPDPVPTPKPVKPKAIFHGANGTGTGGNAADDFKPGGNEGVAGGRGDQGAPGGNPNSTNYTGGGHGNSGLIATGGLRGLRMLSVPSFTDDFNQNAKIVLSVHVDENGNVTSAEYDMRGSTTSAGNLIAIAIRKIKQVKFEATGQEHVGGFIVNLKVHN